MASTPAEGAAKVGVGHTGDRRPGLRGPVAGPGAASSPKVGGGEDGVLWHLMSCYGFKNEGLGEEAPLEELAQAFLIGPLVSSVEMGCLAPPTSLPSLKVSLNQVNS